ncbi:MAG: hypothetical protein QME88_12595 [Actinomycetota bacterium]|nr:hypothetical protein [Actinomycetota bacterium]
MDMEGKSGTRDGARIENRGARAAVRLLCGLALATMVVSVLMMSARPGRGETGRTALSQVLVSPDGGVEIDGDGLASRVVEQRFQIHMEETDQQMGEIPYVEIWVLNDPFYPLMGPAGNLRSSDGNLANKQWQMLGFPDYEQQGAATGSAPPTSPSSSLPVTTSVPQRVVMLKDVYEMRGIRYADIKVNDNTYTKLKAGSEFAEVFKVQEVKSDDTVVVVCGDETYELKKNELRKI